MLFQMCNSLRDAARTCRGARGRSRSDSRGMKVFMFGQAITVTPPPGSETLLLTVLTPDADSPRAFATRGEGASVERTAVRVSLLVCVGTIRLLLVGVSGRAHRQLRLYAYGCGRVDRYQAGIMTEAGHSGSGRVFFPVPRMYF